MDTGNWRPTQGASGAVVDPSMESGDWRAQLQADSRQRIVNKIMDTLKRLFPFSINERLQELENIAVRFEEKIYTAATSQSDYVQKISLKLLTMENRSQNPMSDAMQSSSAPNSVNPSDPGSSSLSSALPPGGGLQQSTMANVAGQNLNLQNIQNMPGVQRNTVANTMGPGNFANQRQQIQGRQLTPQQQQQLSQQQTQNLHHLYQQKLHQMAKQTFQQPPMQSHIQQQNLLQPGHLQPSQQSVMQPKMMQTSSLSSAVQNQRPVVPQSSQPLMNHQQSVLRQRQQRVQPTQKQVQSTQRNPTGQQANATNTQQNQLIRQQINYSDMQEQQQQRLIGQQNKLSSAQQPQQQLTDQHNNLSSMQQLTGQQQQQRLLGSQSGNSNMQTNQHSVQQFLHKQQFMQQQQQHQFHQQTKQQQPSGQMEGKQLSQLHQISDGGDIKLRQQMSVKSGAFHHAAASQRSAYHQQLKTGAQFSPELLSPASPQMSQHASPQIDQSNMFKSANSPFTVPSSSMSSASPIPGESINGAPSLSNVGNIGHQQASSAVLPTQSLATGISASPLLAEFTSPDGNHGADAVIGSGKSATDQPLERLLKVVKSVSPKALSASVSDIGSVMSMIDRIAGSAPGKGSRTAVGEDLVAMTKYRLQARNFVTQDGTNGTRKMKRFTSEIPLSVVSSGGCVNDSFKQLNASELDSTAFSSIKRLRTESSNHALLEEINEINQGLIDTVVSISEEDVDPAAASAVSEGEYGTVITCSFSAVSLGPNLKSLYASGQMSPIQPLRLLVPANYPNCSPILLDKFPTEVSKEFEDISTKTKSRFSISLRSFSQPMSLKDIARTWDACAAAVMSEYAQQRGGGTFSSKYVTWENRLIAV